MHLRIYFIAVGAVLLGYTNADETGRTTPWKDEIYIDDDDLEGSGGGKGEIRDDLESSGSGYGLPPDDDDHVDPRVDPGSGDDQHPAPPAPSPPKETPRIKEEPTLTRQDVSGVGSAPKGETNEDITHGEPQPQPEDDSEDTDPTVHRDPTMNVKHDERATSFFAQPGILAAVIGGAVVGLLCAILVVMFIVYRMRKKDEGSYALDEPKRSPTVNSYTKNSNREFYA
ncbi:syndecan isoform X2 [Anabrus simplex]|uniref:syndecan isoform X2 n=1 Tax=Anabrus simplex TaxID=316456 RepID=UPI0035A27D79